MTSRACRLGFVVAVISAHCSAAGAATTIGFNEIPANPRRTVGGSYVPLPESVVTDRYRPLGILFGREGVSAGVAVTQVGEGEPVGAVGLDAAGSVPGTQLGANVGDIYFRFVLPGTDTPATANDVRFTVGDGGGDVDLFQIRSYGPVGDLLDTRSYAFLSYSPVTIPVGNVHRLEIDFTGDFGYLMDDLTFTVVPEPAAAALLASAAGLLLHRPRRR